MSYHSTKVDLLFDSGGDFIFDEDTKDFKDTTEIKYRAFLQQIHTVLMSSTGDWKSQPSLGANLKSFLGKPNTAELGNAIRNRITQSVLGIMKQTEFSIEVFPISAQDIGIILLIEPEGDRVQLRLVYSYNTKDNILFSKNF